MKKLDIALCVAPMLKKFPRLSRAIRKIARETSPNTVILLDYPINQKQRWTPDKPHELLHEMLNKKINTYKEVLESFLNMSEYLADIPSKIDNELLDGPYWENSWIPALDGIALYGFIASQKPKVYLEIGSGNSTKFAKKAIDDFRLGTKIISVDPQPRAEIDKLCHQVIRKPIEDVSLSTFDALEENDILFVDSSHRSFMNSDVTTVFLDILPRLKHGVLVQLHDVTLPYDYPVDWEQRWYSEQYLLAAMLLSEGNSFDVVLPNSFLSHNQELNPLLTQIFSNIASKPENNFGYSFWMRKSLHKQ